MANLKAALEQIRAQAEVENIRVTQPAQQEMVEEDITLDEVLEAIATGRILENYPEHRRGSVVCSTALPKRVILCTSCAQRYDRRLSLLQFMNPNHQSGQRQPKGDDKYEM